MTQKISSLLFSSSLILSTFPCFSLTLSLGVSSEHHVFAVWYLNVVLIRKRTMLILSGRPPRILISVCRVQMSHPWVVFFFFFFFFFSVGGQGTWSFNYFVFSVNYQITGFSWEEKKKASLLSRGSCLNIVWSANTVSVAPLGFSLALWSALTNQTQAYIIGFRAPSIQYSAGRQQRLCVATFGKMSGWGHSHMKRTANINPDWRPCLAFVPMRPDGRAYRLASPRQRAFKKKQKNECYLV